MTPLTTHVPMTERTITAAFDHQVRARPDKLALIDDDGSSATYAQARDLAGRIASGLHALGVQRQEPVLVLLDNHVDYALTWLGLGLGAMVHVPVNTAYKGEMLRYVVRHSGARVVIADAAYAERIAEVIRETPTITTVVVRGSSTAELPDTVTRVAFDALLRAEPGDPWPTTASDIASILYTSGTTGPSKGVLCPHGQAFAASFSPETHTDSVALVALPLFHGTGLWTGIFRTLRCGATAVIMAGFSVAGFWEQVRRHRCTTTVLVGGMAEFLNSQPPGAGDRDHSLETVIILPCPGDPDAWQERFGVQVSSGYGATEIGIGATTRLGEAQASGCGTPRPNLDMRVVDENDEEVDVGVGGELVVRALEPWTMMLGYHDMPEETLRAFRNLWFHSGDLVYRDEIGRLVFVDRKKDAIRRRGENVSSFEVEAQLLSVAGVAEAAVVPVAGEFADDEIKAVLVLEPGVDFRPEAILADLYERMPHFMVPRYYEAVAALPYTPTHKVRKSELRAEGVTVDTWDCEQAGYRITRRALVAPAQPVVTP